MDNRTKENIDTLHPNAQDWAKAFYDAVMASGVLPSGFVIKIISGNRTWAEQDELYAIGRTKELGRDPVTNARGGQSNHNFGIAWDIGIFDANGKYLPESRFYALLGPVGKAIGLHWGGDWKRFVDRPHYEVPVPLSMLQMRTLMLAGKSVPVPKYANDPAPDPEPQSSSNDKDISILENGKATNVPGYLHDGHVWVAIRKFTETFGGHIVSVGSSDKTFTLYLNGTSTKVVGVIENGVGFVKFVDLNQVLQWGYKFTGSELDITTK